MLGAILKHVEDGSFPTADREKKVQDHRNPSSNDCLRISYEKHDFQPGLEVMFFIRKDSILIFSYKKQDF